MQLCPEIETAPARLSCQVTGKESNAVTWVQKGVPRVIREVSWPLLCAPGHAVIKVARPPGLATQLATPSHALPPLTPLWVWVRDELAVTLVHRILCIYHSIKLTSILCPPTCPIDWNC